MLAGNKVDQKACHYLAGEEIHVVLSRHAILCPPVDSVACCRPWVNPQSKHAMLCFLYKWLVSAAPLRFDSECRVFVLSDASLVLTPC